MRISSVHASSLNSLGICSVDRGNDQRDCKGGSSVGGICGKRSGGREGKMGGAPAEVGGAPAGSGRGSWGKWEGLGGSGRGSWGSGRIFGWERRTSKQLKNSLKFKQIIYKIL